ncbi:MAG TPA: phosphoribosylanthranilate isomerase [Polyangiaceae bacterium]
MARVKVCGVTNVEDASMCLREGVSAIGLNFVASSPRRVTEEDARAIVDAVRGRVLVVGVVADLSVAEMIALRDRVRLGCLQLHGEEPPEALAPLLPHAYKAIRIATASDVTRADGYGGEHILVDAKRPGALGGTGETFDWSLVAGLAGRRRLTLAGGIRPENVTEAIRVVSPYCVDVASGVEVPGDPRKKDAARVRELVSLAAPRDR